MKKYNYEFLTWYDFENLARDVVQTRENIILENFADGRDGGIDFRRIYDQKSKMIVQSKHYSDRAKLLAHLEKKELSKVRKLKPSRYVLVISLDLTVAQKNKLTKLFTPYILNPNDIICAKDIESLLDDHEELLKKNHKLWLTSAKVLELVLHKKILNRSDRLNLDIQQKAKLYVETASVDKALEIIDSHHYVVISGVPGIGKTTLAQILSLYHVKDGYQLAYVTSIDEAEEIIGKADDDSPLMIYYDDFLGKVRFSPERNEDKRLANFLRRVGASPRTRMIMTTREYILRQAKQAYEELDDTDLDIAKVTIELGSYTDFQKAHILYNHLYYSSLDKSFLQNILEERSYRKIIDHRNYNPRLIEAMTTAQQLLTTDAKHFTDDFVALLDNPARVWEKAFEAHINQTSRALLYTLYLSPSTIELDTLGETTHAFIKQYLSLTHATDYATAFRLALKELDGSFIRTDLKRGRRIVQFANPSIIDFLTTYIDQNLSVKEALIRTATYLEPQLEHLSLTKKPHTVCLDGALATHYIAKLIANYEHYRDVELSVVPRSLRQLNKIYDEYGQPVQRQLLKFLREKGEPLRLPESFTDSDLITYLAFENNMRIKRPKVMRQIVRATVHNACDVDDLKKIATFRVFEEELLEDEALEETIDLPQLFADTVAECLANIGEHNADELEGLLESVEEIEATMDYDLGSEKEDIESAIGALNYFDEDLMDIDRGVQVSGNTDIDSLFQTLNN